MDNLSFQSPLLSLPFIDNTVLYSSSFYESGWEPHLRVSEAAATQYQVGMTFFLVGLSYMLTSLPAGAVSNMQTVMNNVYHISGIFLLILSGLQWVMVPHNRVHGGKYSVGFGLHTHRSRALLGWAYTQLHWPVLLCCRAHRSRLRPHHGGQARICQKCTPKDCF